MKKLNRNDSVLDNTLRQLYIALRNRRCPLMAIEFKHKGTVWKADTVEEAVALRNELEASDKAFVPEHDAMDQFSNFWTPDRFMDVINHTGETQQKLLIAIRRKPGITSRELVRELRMDSEIALAGVVSGLSKQLKKLEIEPKQVFLVDVKWKGKVKTRRFILNDFFVGAGVEQGWPDAWEKPKKK
jgi:hypothetical protein